MGEIRLDYHGESSKTCHNKNPLKNEYPLLRFDLKNLNMTYKIDQEGRYAHVKFSHADAKQFYKSNINERMHTEEMINPKFAGNSGYESITHRKPFMPKKHLNTDSKINLGNKYDYAHEHDKLIAAYSRPDTLDPSED